MRKIKNGKKGNWSAHSSFPSLFTLSRCDVWRTFGCAEEEEEKWKKKKEETLIMFCDKVYILFSHWPSSKLKTRHLFSLFVCFLWWWRWWWFMSPPPHPSFYLKVEINVFKPWKQQHVWQERKKSNMELFPFSLRLPPLLLLLLFFL